jgi:phage protein D
VSSNALPVQPDARQPRGIVRVNGQSLAWIDMEVDNNTYHQADTFSVSLPLSELKMPYDAAWLFAQDPLTVEVFMGLPADPQNFGAADLVSYILGHVDTIGFSPTGRTLTLSGRDLTSLLIDAKTSEKWPNQTASDVATTLAKRHGLTPVVTATTTKIGHYYQIDHVRLTCAMTEWELLTWLAAVEGFRVYVKGMELHFEPEPTPSTASNYTLAWENPTGDTGHYASNTKQIDFERTLTVGKSVVVQVRSWNQKQKKGFSATYPTSKAKGILPGTATERSQVYTFIIPNLTQEQALQRAQAKYNEIIKHEMRMNASLPADDILTPQSVIAVTGTGTPFDQIYYPESVTRSLGIDEGYRMQVRAKNHSADTQVIQ